MGSEKCLDLGVKMEAHCYERPYKIVCKSYFKSLFLILNDRGALMGFDKDDMI